MRDARTPVQTTARSPPITCAATPTSTSASRRCIRSPTTPSPRAASTTCAAGRSRSAGRPSGSSSSTSTRASPASSAADRAGFQRLVADVSLGKAGIVLGLECSRLARNNADWHRLLQLCAFNDTLICDEDGLYDPCTINDRLLLGLKGTMSEAELHFIRARLQGGILAKAARGELAVAAAGRAGLRRRRPGRARPRRRRARAPWRTCSPCSKRPARPAPWSRPSPATASPSPVATSPAPRAGELYWKPLRHDHVLFVLHNPRYAGAYCYGRRRHVSDADGHQRTFVKPPHRMDHPDPRRAPRLHHLGTVRSQPGPAGRQRPARGQDRRAGPPREGPALLQGLLVCGKCGTRMTVGYHTRADGSLRPGLRLPTRRHRHRHPALPDACAASGIDAAVAEFVLAALTPLALAGRAHRHRRTRRTGRRRRPGPCLPRASAPSTPPTPRGGATSPSTPPTGSSPTHWKPTGTTGCANSPTPRRLRPGQRQRRRAHRHPDRPHPRAGRRPARAVERPGHSDAGTQTPDPAARHRRHAAQNRRAHQRRHPPARRPAAPPDRAPAAHGLGTAQHPRQHPRP